MYMLELTDFTNRYETRYVIYIKNICLYGMLSFFTTYWTVQIGTSMFNCAFKTVNFGSLIKRAKRHFGIALLVPISRNLSRKIKWTQRISDINVKQNSTIHFMRGKVLPRAGHEGPEGEYLKSMLFLHRVYFNKHLKWLLLRNPIYY